MMTNPRACNEPPTESLADILPRLLVRCGIEPASHAVKAASVNWYDDSIGEYITEEDLVVCA